MGERISQHSRLQQALEVAASARGGSKLGGGSKL